MKCKIPACSLLMALMLVCSRTVAVYSQQNLTDAALQGYVFGSGPIGHQPLDWARVSLKNGQQSYEVFSGMSGFYQIYLPGGTYNITVDVPVDPSYMAYNTTLNIPNGTTTLLNFQLQQVVPVPEFPSNLALLLIASTVAVTLLISKKRPKSSNG